MAAAERMALKPIVVVDLRECCVCGASTIANVDTKDNGLLVYTPTRFDEQVPK